jgi:hypothetical protein
MVVRQSESRHFQLDVHVAVPVLLQYDLGVGSSVYSVRLLPHDHQWGGRTEPAEWCEEACLIGIARVDSRVVCKPMRGIRILCTITQSEGNLDLSKGLLHYLAIASIRPLACALTGVAILGSCVESIARGSQNSFPTNMPSILVC